MREGSAFEVLLAFLKLGVTSFGGPIAHIGYFREEIVVRRRWLEDSTYTDLVALCQFLPGPASSQVGFSLGLIGAGYWGGLAAWVGFTLPSALLLVAFAHGSAALSGAQGTGITHALKLVAVAIVAQAVWGMGRTLCPDRDRIAIAGVAALLVLLISSWITQIGAILIGAVAGFWLCRSPAAHTAHVLITPVSRIVGLVALASFFVLLVSLYALRNLSQDLAFFEAFYRSGALVFGGGHVVLPLLSQAFVTPGWVNQNDFISGYGAAQAIPGPLFTFAAYLGAVVRPAHYGIAGAALGLIGIFLPGMLILLGTLPFWDVFRRRVGAQAVMRGVNAAVVGLLAAALYTPLWTSSVNSSADFALALVGFIILMVWRAPPILVVIVVTLGSVLHR